MRKVLPLQGSKLRGEIPLSCTILCHLHLAFTWKQTGLAKRVPTHVWWDLNAVESNFHIYKCRKMGYHTWVTFSLYLLVK